VRSSLAALFSVVAASLCCLPLGTLLVATGTGSAALLVPPAAQPWLMALAVAFLLLGAWRIFVRPTCAADTSWGRKALLSFAAVIIAAMWLAPQQVASVIAGRPPATSGRATPAAPPALTISSIDAVRIAFNEAVNDTRLIVLLSPT
jgi:hypothetical protein